LTCASIRSSTFIGTTSRSGSIHQVWFTRPTVSVTVLKAAASGKRARLAKAFHRCTLIALKERSPASDSAMASAGM
jgi:hypothetical protein